MSEARRSPVPVIVAAVVGLLLVLGARAVFSGGSSSDVGAISQESPAPATSVDTSCTVVNLAASSEKAALLKKVAGEYNAQRRTVGSGCAQVAVVSKASGGAEQALARGWDENVDGPRPDVWSPAASSWTVLLRQDLTAQDREDLVPDQLPSLAQTPLVVAMPRPMAEALGWPSKPIGWSDLFALAKDPRGWGSKGHPEWGKFKLGKTNPRFSTSGLNATVATYFAATGRSSDLSAKDVADPKVQAFVKQIESSVVHYGDTTLTFLSNMAKADAAGRGLTYVSAVTVEEKSVWDYNQGNPTGDPTTLGQGAKPKVPLVAIYPKDGTLLSDNPYVVLKAPWVDDAKKAVAADFLAYVTAPERQALFQEAAFRSFEGKPGPTLVPANGALEAGAPVVLAPPAPTVLAAVQRSWDDLRKRARVLMILDVSGSMGENVEKAGQSRLELAKSAATKAVRGFAPNDQLGLWIFSTQQDGNRPYVERVPVGDARSTVPKITSEIADLVPDGGTGLYATLRAAQAAMLDDLDPDKINAIVILTDGRNEYPPDTDLDSLVAQLGGESLDTSVRVFPIGYSTAADKDALVRIAEASSAAYYDASDPATIDKILTSVLSNF
ncbi:MAG: substrate-binding and VWA domain-containing protein [Candidatus Nanopelagicales bacterium]